MNLLHHISIKNKLILIILVVSLLAIGIGFGFVILHNIRSYKDDMVSSIRAPIEVTGGQCALPLQLDYKTSAENEIKKLQTLPQILEVVLFDKDNNIYAAFNRNTEKTADEKGEPLCRHHGRHMPGGAGRRRLHRVPRLGLCFHVMFGHWRQSAFRPPGLFRASVPFSVTGTVRMKLEAMP